MTSSALMFSIMRFHFKKTETLNFIPTKFLSLLSWCKLRISNISMQMKDIKSASTFKASTFLRIQHINTNKIDIHTGKSISLMINTSYRLPSPEPREIMRLPSPQAHWSAGPTPVNETHSKKAWDVTNSSSAVLVFVVYKMWQDVCFNKLPWVLTTQ